MSYQALITALKGGTGSGNWGHSGRPGKRGGSAVGTGGKLGDFAVTSTLRDLFTGKTTYDGDSRKLVAELFTELGYDAKPTLIDVLDPAATPLHRGIAGEQSAKHADDFKHGDLFIGDGIYGSGTYTAYGFDGARVAAGYAGKSGSMLEMALTNNAKIITDRELNTKLGNIVDAAAARADRMVVAAHKAYKMGDVDKANKLLMASGNLRVQANDLYKAMTSDYAIAAAAMGYDAIHVDTQRYMIVLNRGKVMVKK